ncbi:TPM domain-containing protein [bacterium]|nr:TPM domain-containing protein [bacterium]
MRRLPALLFFFLASASIAFAQAKVPALTARVNDYANILDATQEQQLEAALAAFEEKTSTQIVVLTTPSLEGEAIEEFGIRVAEAWRIGQKGKDNGAILIVAPNDRLVRIEVGYGLEGALTDLESSRIIRNVVVPAFKSGSFFAGIAGGVDGMMKATEGEFKAEGVRMKDDRTRGGQSVVSIIFSIIVFIVLMSSRTGRMILFTGAMMGGGRRGGFGGGGGFSGGGGGFGGGGASGRW